MSKLTLTPVLLLLALPGLQAQPKARSVSPSAARPLELAWSELAPLIGNRKVRMALPDGAVITGETVTVRNDALVIDVKKTSNASVYPKGYTPVPRATVNLLQVERRSRKGARAISTTVGVISGFIGGAYVAATAANDSAGAFVGTWTALSTAGSVGGFLIGREIDTQTTYIKVIE